jgi:hypothetical protein
MKALMKKRGEIYFYKGSNRSQKRGVEIRFINDQLMCKEINPFFWTTIREVSFCSYFAYGLSKKQETGEVYIYKSPKILKLWGVK